MTSVLAYPADDGGCGRYRVIWPGRVLAERGYDVKVVPADAENDQIAALWQDQKNLLTGEVVRTDLLSVIPPGADVVVMQRPLTRHGAKACELMRAHARVVIEIDDDFDALSPRNISTKALSTPERNSGWLREAIKHADALVVSTPALADRYGPLCGEVHIVPNMVPESYLKIRPGTIWRYVGWTGSIATHPDDLQVTDRGVARAVEKVDRAALGVVGTGLGVAKRLGLNAEPDSVGWRPIDEYPEWMARFHCGIVPLEDSPFNRAKSYLKGLEFAALGVPYVASPLPEYKKLADAGVGLLAANGRQWEGCVKRLLTESEDDRLERLTQMQAVVAEYTIEQHATAWWQAWTGES